MIFSLVTTALPMCSEEVAARIVVDWRAGNYRNGYEARVALEALIVKALNELKTQQDKFI